MIPLNSPPKRLAASLVRVDHDLLTQPGQHLCPCADTAGSGGNLRVDLAIRTP
eukprot:CAMPEP_0171287596 /NCGR_PEP_ID=MMETSP0790-20130122/69647_1 /TAXON_ID=2925 /ORGANISM="Alexandrium catenella, Strain OF101" /LENGTH=52 /DNA_ID=CAMNT_0011757151 /DNA_START=33 /DNA_END=187 /DNA_ORIENTATION=+